jgi:hypothetical protein
MLGVVALVSIGGLAMLGGNVFSGMVSHRNMFASVGPSQAFSGSLNPSGPTAPTSSLNLPNVPQGFLGTERVCSESFCIDLPVINQENQRIDTAGGNGGDWIQAFSAVLDQLAAELLAAGVEPDIVSYISKLALDGHSLGTTTSEMANNSSEDGRTVPAGQGEVNNFNSIANKFNYSHFLLKNFLESSPEALSPMAQAIIEMQVGQINGVLRGIEMDLSPFSQAKDANVTFHEVDLIHQSANTICDQGGENCHYVANN